MNLALNLLCLSAVVVCLWRYFGFVGFNLAKLESVSSWARIWNLVLAVGFPLVGLSFFMQEDYERILVGIGISTILVPAIVPDLDPPKSGSLPEWVYFRTVGKAFSDFVSSAVIYVLLLVCSAFGVFWVGVYAGIAIALGIGRSLWIRVQKEQYSSEAAPPIRRLMLVFVASFGWIMFLTVQIKLTRHALQSELSDLYRPLLWTTIGNWFFARLPRLLPAMRLPLGP
jgi:hypothetical protein